MNVVFLAANKQYPSGRGPGEDGFDANSARPIPTLVLPLKGNLCTKKIRSRQDGFFVLPFFCLDRCSTWNIQMRISDCGMWNENLDRLLSSSTRRGEGRVRGAAPTLNVCNCSGLPRSAGTKSARQQSQKHEKTKTAPAKPWRWGVCVRSSVHRAISARLRLRGVAGLSSYIPIAEFSLPFIMHLW